MYYSFLRLLPVDTIPKRLVGNAPPAELTPQLYIPTIVSIDSVLRYSEIKMEIAAGGR